jgi:hypothetical protein
MTTYLARDAGQDESPEVTPISESNAILAHNNSAADPVEALERFDEVQNLRHDELDNAFTFGI